MFFKKKIEQRSFNDVLTALGAQKFDVSPAGEGAAGAPGGGRTNGAKREPSAYRVSKYGCAADIAPVAAEKSKAEKGNRAASAEIRMRPGILLNGQIARVLDRGYQKFLETPKLTIVATADHLRAIHQFTEELDQAIGGLMLYNESLGTTSNRYVYDRVKGREEQFARDRVASADAANDL